MKKDSSDACRFPFFESAAGAQAKVAVGKVSTFERFDAAKRSPPLQPAAAPKPSAFCASQDEAPGVWSR